MSRSDKFISVRVWLLLLVAVAVFCSNAFAASDDAEAPFRLVKKYKEFEERLYPQQKWICNKVQDSNYGMSDNLRQFYKLVNYRNDKGVEIPMTIPVNMKKTFTDGKPTYEMCLYIPTNLQYHTPVPVDAEVYILEVPERTIFAKRYSGWILTESQWSEKAEEFRRILIKAGKNNDVVDFDYYHGCAFSSPTTFFNRRNEVWYVKKQ